MLEEQWVKGNLGVKLKAKQLSGIAKMDEPKNIDELSDNGRDAVQVKEEHFRKRFDVA